MEDSKQIAKSEIIDFVRKQGTTVYVYTKLGMKHYGVYVPITKADALDALTDSAEDYDTLEASFTNDSVFLG